MSDSPGCGGYRCRLQHALLEAGMRLACHAQHAIHLPGQVALLQAGRAVVRHEVGLQLLSAWDAATKKGLHGGPCAATGCGN